MLVSTIVSTVRKKKKKRIKVLLNQALRKKTEIPSQRNQLVETKKCNKIQMVKTTNMRKRPRSLIDLIDLTRTPRVKAFSKEADFSKANAHSRTCSIVSKKSMRMEILSRGRDFSMAG
jgi:hypothetical protein